NYRDELHTACRLAELPLPSRLHVVGGGSRNALLNQLTADALGIEVVAGPMEATALGNLAVQARALSAVPSHDGAIRELIRASVDLETFSPSSTRAPRASARSSRAGARRRDRRSPPRAGRARCGP